MEMEIETSKWFLLLLFLHVLFCRLNMRVAVTYSTENTLKLRHSICFEKPDTSKNLCLKPGAVGQNVASHASPAARISVGLYVTVNFISPVVFGYILTYMS